jgi:hypothetical protein
MTTFKAKKVLVAGLCAATLGGTLVTTASPAEAQWRRPGYGQPYYRNYRRGNGGAIAAGVVGGLALGALAAGAARPAYAAPIAPGYGYGAVPAYGGGCYEVRRRFVDDWGRTFVRRETVCE